MFEFSASKDMKNKYNNGKRRMSTYLLGYLLTLILIKLENSIEHNMVVTTLNITKH